MVGIVETVRRKFQGRQADDVLTEAAHSNAVFTLGAAAWWLLPAGAFKRAAGAFTTFVVGIRAIDWFGAHRHVVWVVGMMTFFCTAVVTLLAGIVIISATRAYGLSWVLIVAPLVVGSIGFINVIKEAIK